MPNACLQKKMFERQELLNEGMRIGLQFASDMFQVALHRKGWGYDRTIALMHDVEEISDYYFEILRPGMEQDIRRVQLDREISDLLKGRRELVPCDKRYDTIKTVGYDRLPKDRSIK